MPQGLDSLEFGRLFEQHVRLLWVVAAAHVPRSMAEDVVQEAALLALQRLSQFTAGTDFRAWIAQIVRHTARNTARRHVRDSKVIPLDAEPPGAPIQSPQLDSNGTLLETQMTFDDRITKALATLHEDARACLLLRTVMDLSHQEIATTLQLAEGTVASHLHRARAFLRTQLAAPLATTSRLHERSNP